MNGSNPKVVVGSNVEGATLDRLADDLVTGLDLSVVRDRLLSSDLVNSEKWEHLNSLLHDGQTYEAVRVTIAAVKRNPPGYLVKFIKILQSEDRTRYFGDMIEQSNNI